ncbi:MAG: translation initiation factor eIF-1A [Nanoarchaeota archaeon]|nr:translation initiation factor eIF-1A [Nanoarchaeota archaeon]MBU1005868.1 translation initiation factor eIF-1A [Nanoarchaeota archaeon]
MSKKKEELAQQEEIQQQISRIHLPRGAQCFGILEQRLGGSRMHIRCFDGKKRVCRIPGRLKRRLWVRAGDLVIVEPWEFSGDKRGDVVYKYSRAQLEFLKRKGYLKQMDEFEEF